MDHFWEKLPEEIQDAQLIWFRSANIYIYIFLYKYVPKHYMGCTYTRRYSLI